MSEYKRLTKKTIGCFKYDIKYYKHKVGDFADYDAFFAYNTAVKRLGELEDKIESGLLVEFPFAVIDKQTKREADEYKISIKEDWAKDLCYCDMDGFAITQDGNLILLDECGKYTYCPCDRFEIIDKARLKELQENKK